MNKFIRLLFLGLFLTSCGSSTVEKKGFQVSEISEGEDGQKIVGLQMDSLKLETRPRNVLLTFHAAHRLTPIFKVNYNRKTKKSFSGSNAFYTHWNNRNNDGNNWHNNFMPGFTAMHGYNCVNVSHFNNATKRQNTLFEKPILLKTLYYPAYSKDTLNFEPVKRDFYMASVYDEDTNKDGFLNVKDLRRFYYFDINGANKKALILKDFSVMSSEYDEVNDYMYVFAKRDTNQNGQMEVEEPTHIFWIDLKNPENRGTVYETE